jgi:nucleotide-binding universal stress UspA family protein
MATRTQSTIARVFTGSLTDEVVRKSDVPVLAMHVSDDAKFYGVITPGLIVVPIDGSELSEAAVDPAIELARRFDAEITFVRSERMPAFVGVSAGMGVALMPNAYQGNIEALSAEAEQYLDRYIGIAESKGVRTSKEIYLGSPKAASITGAGKSEENSMIVIATHGRSGLERTIFGSTTDELIRKSDLPILVFKSPDAPGASE